jgi:hypothetical protein
MIDLNSLVPEKFNEIPYVSQINVKRKGMEHLNQELEKLVQRQKNEEAALVRTNKDYTQIFNVLQHMLEDPNMLVFIEAIRMVEHLAVLLGPSIKVAKIKVFIKLLAEKYKEVKTAVLTSLERTFDSILDNRCIPPLAFFDQMINSTAHSHKNPRVKQMVIDRVELLIEKLYMTPDGQGQDLKQLGQVFKQTQEKLKTIILKDTNAQVRDSGISLLTTLRIILSNTETEKSAQEVIDSLPKFRVQEIMFRIQTYQNQMGTGQQGPPPTSAREMEE